MGFFDKTRYLRTLLSLAPMGLVLIYFGSKSLLTNIDDLPKIKGKIESIKHENTISSYKNQSYLVPITNIRLSNTSVQFTTAYEGYKNLIDSTLSNGDEIVIWTKEVGKSKNEIVQIEKDGKLIIIYHKSNVFSWGCLIAGIIISFIAIVYLIKYPEDLLGKKK
jgi:hypothetical protein